MSLFKKPSELVAKPGIVAMIYGQPGSGKAQPLYSKILTPTGFKSMGFIKAGDVIMGSDGYPQTVTAVFPQGKRPVYEVRTNDGAVIRCDLEHLWNVRHSTGNSRKAGWRTLTLRDMIEKGILCPLSPSRERTGRQPIPRFEIPVVSPIDFPTRTFDVDPYVLGVLIGDGNLTGSTALFSNPDLDKEIADKVADRLPQGYHLQKDSYGSCPRYIISMDDKEKGKGFLNRLKDLYLNVKSGEKFIPKEYLLGDKVQRLELMRGLMDTDGCCMDGCKVTYSTTSARLASDMVELVNSLGGLATVTLYPHEDKNDCYTVRIKINECPFSLTRKASNWNTQTIGRL